MSAIAKLTRCALIIEKIQQTKYPSMQAIVSFLRKMDAEASERTVQRDIEQIRTDSQIFIEYDRFHRGYYIEDSPIVQKRIRLLQAHSMSTHFLQFLNENPKHSDAVLLNDELQVKGLEFVEPILSAIKDSRQLEFTYKKFYDEQQKRYVVQPYAIKEFRNRWYLVCTGKSTEKLLKFGLDRILSLQIQAQKFVKNKKLDVREHFSKMVGVHSENENREKVQLQFTDSQAKYIETLPLHWSQEVHSKTESHVVFSYFLIVNYEWIQQILSYGDQVKVLQPKWLVIEHKNILKQTLKQY
ncbi:MAG: WYL domain-containing protein [Chitinophagales bacterium]|nr:WYL domain-containing protein [Bacteroidota bacterium]